MIYNGDALTVLKTLPENLVNMCVTSPPYWGLRDYGVEGQLGLEKSPDEYVQNLVEVFREVRRILKPDGTLWLNLGDTYNSTGGHSQKESHMGLQSKIPGLAEVTRNRIAPGVKVKDLIGIPWRVAFALQKDGWYLRQDIIWHKPNPMPESVRDRCTKAHEYIFLLAKSQKYFIDALALKEKAVSGEKFHGNYKDKSILKRTSSRNGRADPANKTAVRNKRSVWTVTTKSFKGAHFATFPPDLITPCILAGSEKGGVVLDPFFGAGTTGVVAKNHGRKFVGIELNPEYIKIAEKRLCG